jgi:hypothetical protein
MLMPELDMLVSEREWPIAVYRGPMFRHAGYFLCETPFSKAAERDGAHGPITLVVMRYNAPEQDPMKPRRMQYSDKKFDRVSHALIFLRETLAQKPSWQPILR